MRDTGIVRAYLILEEPSHRIHYNIAVNQGLSAGMLLSRTTIGLAVDGRKTGMF